MTKLTDKIPFDIKIAETVMITMHLVTKMSKQMNGSLTTKQIEEMTETMRKKYYNDKVELLNVD